MAILPPHKWEVGRESQFKIWMSPWCIGFSVEMCYVCAPVPAGPSYYELPISRPPPGVDADADPTSLGTVTSMVTSRRTAISGASNWKNPQRFEDTAPLGIFFF